MRCDDAGRFLQAYLDGELDRGDRGDIEVHLRACPACRQVARHEAWFRDGLRAAAVRTPAPEALRRRILEQVRAQAPERPPMRLTSLWAVAPAALALAVIATLGALVLDLRSRPAVRTADAIDIHRRHLPAEVQAPDPDQVRRWFWGKVDFPVRLPAPPASAALPVRLVGARLSHVGPFPAAHMMYDLGGAPMSVMAFRGPPPAAASGDVTTPGSRPVRLQRADGYNVAFVEDHDITYAITGEVDPGQLVRFASGGLR